MIARLVTVLLPFLILLPAPARAQTLDIAVSSDAARLQYGSDVLGGSLGRLEGTGGLLYNGDDDFLFNLGLQVRGENLDAPVLAALGLRLYVGDAGNDSVTGLALGGELTFSPDAAPGLELGAYLYFAPDPLAFSDISGLIDWGVRVGYQIIPLSTLYVGYQRVAVDLERGGEYELDDSVVVGLRLAF